MKTSKSILTLFLACLFVVISALPLPAQDEESSRRSELGVRQRLVERKMLELETKLTVIAEKLREKEPKRAELLVQAYQQSKEKLITKKMAQAGKLLDSNKLTEADSLLDEVIANIESLVRLLTQKKDIEATKQEEMAQLEKWKAEFQKVLEEQQVKRRETDNIANKEKAIDKLQGQINKLKGLIDDQKAVIEETKNKVGAGLRALDKVADKQFEVREKTKELTDELSGVKDPSEGMPSDGKPSDGKPNDGKPNDGKPNDGKPNDGKPNDGKPNDGKPNDGKPNDGKPNDGKPSDGKPSDGKPSDGKPNDGKPSDGKPSDGKPSDGKPSDGKPSDGKPSDGKPSDGKPSDGQSGDQQKQPPKPGQESLEKATKAQELAEEKLGSGKPEDAKRQEEKALDELENALSEIEKEKRRIESLPEDALEQMAEKQRRTRDKALDLVKEMKAAPKPKNEEGAQAGSQSPQQPGQEKMNQAGDAMKQASDQMEENDPDKAQEQQKVAEKNIQEAIEEIEDRLKQLRDETREEKLARLEGRFRQMLEEQIVVSVMTIELDDKLTNLGKLRRRDQLLMLQLSNNEIRISELGQQAYDLLLEDGTSIVFPEIVQDLRADLKTAADLLQKEKTGQYTQLVQKEIETTIEDLLDALKEAQKDGGLSLIHI